MIQMTQETATLLTEHGKGHWCLPRPDMVEAKGKGSMATFFLKIPAHNAKTESIASSSDDNRSVETSADFKSLLDNTQATERITAWTVEVLAKLLKDIEIRRLATGSKRDSKYALAKLEQSSTMQEATDFTSEVKEIVELPKFDIAAAAAEDKVNRATIELKEVVLKELSRYVQCIAVLYRDNRK